MQRGLKNDSQNESSGIPLSRPFIHASKATATHHGLIAQRYQYFTAKPLPAKKSAAWRFSPTPARMSSWKAGVTL